MAFKHLPGVNLPHRKSTENMKAVVMPTPKEVLIPLSMHIGAPSTPIVKVGDEVKVGQLIADASGFVSSKIHSSVSGKVKSTDSTILSNGRKIPAILIESDGKDELFDGIVKPEINSLADLSKAILDAGIIGLGGAGFPTQVKVGVKDKDLVKEIVINGAECEPYITSDTRTMLDKVDDMKNAILTLQKILEPSKIFFGIEKNKPSCIKSVKEMISDVENASVLPLETVYPQGGEKVLIYHTTGKIVGEGKLPLDVGVIVLNCTTLAEIGKYLRTGIPLTHKVLTLDGSAIKNKMNVYAPVGTRIKDIVEFSGGYCETPKKILLGGPMMGVSIESDEQPIMKNTNAVLAFNKKDATPAKESACIRCGACVNACPFGLDPREFVKALRLKDDDRLVEAKANLCMECGCCAFACPAKRELVGTNRIAKQKAMAKIKANAVKK